MKIDLVKQLINEFENSEVFKMKVEIDDIKLELEKTPVAPVNVVSTPVVSAPTPTLAPVEQVAANEQQSPEHRLNHQLLGFIMHLVHQLLNRM